MAGTSNISTIWDALVTRVSGATGVENVYKGSRLTYDWGDFITQFQTATGQKVLAFTTSVRKISEKRLTNLENELRYLFLIRGYATLEEVSSTSEAAFVDKIAAICDEFRETWTLDASAEFQGPAQVSPIDERIFGGVLVHYCEITVEVSERLTGA